jgi:mannose-6-phosphate isomerase-like protein (cupin superfamily)
MYLVLEGNVEMCLGGERRVLTAGQAAYIPCGEFHQATNIGSTPARIIYCYGPAGDVAHWKQELSGTLPKAGVDAPCLPAGAAPQCTEKPA